MPGPNPNGTPANLIPGGGGAIKGLMTPKQRKQAIILFDVWTDTGDLNQACLAAKLPLSTALYWKTKYTWFRKRFDEQKEWLTEVAESVAYSRSVHGWIEPVYGRVGRDTDGVVGEIRKFDNKLLQQLLRSRRPEWSERTQQLGANGSPADPHGTATVILVHPQMTNLTDFAELCKQSAQIQADNKRRVIEHAGTTDQRADSA